MTQIDIKNKMIYSTYFKILSLFTFIFCYNIALHSQMKEGNTILFGNEWFDDGAQMLKLKIWEKGTYKINKQVLTSAGISNTLQGNELQLFRNGIEIPISTSQEGAWGETDYFTFEGNPNTADLDKYVLPNGIAGSSNPLRSLYSDTAYYFISVNNKNTHLRTTQIENDLTNAPPKENFLLYTNHFSSPEFISGIYTISGTSRIQRSNLLNGTGYVNGAVSVIQNIPVFDLVTNAILPKFESRGLTNSSSLIHNIPISINNSVITTIKNFSQSRFDFRQVADTQRVLKEGSNELKIQSQMQDLDYLNLGVFKYTYPRSPILRDQKMFQFQLFDNNKKNYIEFLLADNTIEGGYLTDSIGNWKILGEKEDNKLKFLIPIIPNLGKITLHIASEIPKDITQLYPATLKKFDKITSNYIIISSQLIMDNSDGHNYVQEYADYRSTKQGGSYLTSVVDIEDLYNSFIYGQKFNPLSIKNFINYIASIGSPKFVFLIGKARNLVDVRNKAALDGAYNLGFRIPSYGFFGSDNLMASQLFDTLKMPVSIGRLPIIKPSELNTYLQKIKSSDAEYAKPGSAEEKSWTKNILQLNGGNVGKPDFIEINSSQLLVKNIFETNLFAGISKVYSKKTDDPVSNPVTEIFKDINNGVAIVDYFGHGAPTTIEIPIDLPTYYQNNPRLPILTIRGCSAGNCNVSGSNLPSTLLFSPQYGLNGYRAVVGSITYSFPGPLATLGRVFYQHLGGDDYGKCIGEVFKNTYNDPIIKGLDEAIQQQFVGDPAIRIYALPGPDLTIEKNSMFTEPSEINSSTDQFSTNFNIFNQGKGLTDTIFYTVSYENAQKKIVETKKNFIANPKTINPISLIFNLDKENLAGENSIYITIDPDNKIAEERHPAAEQNNEYYSTSTTKGYKFYGKTNSIKPIYPTIFSIVGHKNVTLNAFSYEIAQKNYDYKFEIDTTDLFNSPLNQASIIQAIPGPLEWKPKIDLVENTVYYWRVTRDSISPDQPASISFSNFTYLKNQEGFAQSHNGQYRLNHNESIKAVGGGNHMTFGIRDNLSILFVNGDMNNNTSPPLIGGYRDGLALRAFNMFNRVPNNQTGFFGVCWYKRDSAFIQYPKGISYYGSTQLVDTFSAFFLAFNPTDQPSRIAMVNYIEDVIGPNDVFMIYNRVQGDFPFNENDWASDAALNNGRTIQSTLNKYGSTKINQFIQNGPQPYVGIFDKKLGLLAEDISQEKEKFSTGVIINAQAHTGSTIQTYGPASFWDKLEWIPKEPSVSFVDKTSIEVKAIHKSDPTKDYIAFKKDLNRNNHVEANLKNIDAKEYPRLQVFLYMADSIFFTSTLDGYEYFRIYGKELPEATSLSTGFQIKKDTLEQGEPLFVKFLGKNIGKYDMDSMLVKLSLISLSGENTTVNTRFSPLKIDSTQSYSFTFDTKILKGNTKLIGEMNPADDQLENIHQNNFFIRDIYIKTDKENPLIDVTFDGEHILDGDIVSTKPLIKILLKDENKIFALQDSSLVSIFISDGIKDSAYSINDPAIKFYPADPTLLQNKNEAIIEFKPEFLRDGIYTLRIQGRDEIGNIIGVNEYKISFEIIKKKSISNIFNYPNPFSNATRFVYTLTGDAMPTYYKIQIMTVSGKIVKEITQTELGPLKIGKHMTDFVWDGKDEYGNKLANGVYLYRMVTKDQDKKTYDKYNLDTKLDTYFTGEWGKMVIIH